MLQQRQKNRKRRGGKKRTTDGLKGEEGEEENKYRATFVGG